MLPHMNTSQNTSSKSAPHPVVARLRAAEAALQKAKKRNDEIADERDALRDFVREIANVDSPLHNLTKERLAKKAQRVLDASFV